jgi:hypothetical protein
LIQPQIGTDKRRMQSEESAIFRADLWPTDGGKMLAGLAVKRILVRA